MNIDTYYYDSDTCIALAIYGINYFTGIYATVVVIGIYFLVYAHAAGSGAGQVCVEVSLPNDKAILVPFNVCQWSAEGCTSQRQGVHSLQCQCSKYGNR